MLITKQFGEQKKMMNSKENFKKDTKKENEKARMCDISGCKVKAIEVW
jgi:hypothetical protein